MSAPGPAPPPATRPNAAQRRAADPDRSVWVTASAGSGKTKVLSDRVLRLLLAGTPPARILCLTFTRAAAAEMAVRINDSLGKWTVIDDRSLDAEIEALTGEPPEPALRTRARRLFAAVLDTPGGLKIMTIHAFCQSLLARFPLEAGVAPHFRLLDDRSAAELMAEAEENLLSSADAAPAIADALAEITRHVDDNRFRELMKALRDQRGRLRTALGGALDEAGLDRLRARLRARLGVAEGETEETIVAAACAEGAFDRAGLARAVKRLREGSATSIARGNTIADWLAADPAGRAARFDDYLRAFLTKADAPRAKLLPQKAAEEDPAAFDALCAEQDRLLKALDRRKAAGVAEASMALLRLGAAILAEYAREKARRARLDYDDLIAMAAALVAEEGVAPWVLYKLDGGIDHILVDEAQDTSPGQWKVIAAIADEFFAGIGAREIRRTLFIVGDEKQSIFSFQGADLDALAEMRAHFAAKAEDAESPLREEPLTRSFRSTAEILAAVDAVFAREEARAGVVFADRKVTHSSNREGQAGLVELWPPAEADPHPKPDPWTPPAERQTAAQADERLAAAIAGTIAEWLECGERLEARDRPIGLGDIMVLVRRRGALVGALARAFKQRGIAIAGSDRLVLTSQMAVMDLIALGQALLLPDDDLTLACVLKGPLVGLDEDALFALAHERPGSLWRALEERRAEREDFAAAHALLSALLARADFTPPFELYAEILGAGGGRRRLVARLGEDANDAIDEFLALALDYEREAVPSLQGFLHWLAAEETEVKRDLERARDAIRIMTVHGAKGLQAPVVFLPDTTGLPMADKTSLLWLRDAPPLLLWPARKERDDPVCRAARAEMRERELAEYRRLLYVAMTRAEDRLYVCGVKPANRKTIPEESWYALVAAGLEAVAEPFEIGPAARDAGLAGKGLRLAGRQTAKPATDRAAASEAEAAAAPLPPYARRTPPPEPAPPRPLAPSRAPSAEPAALSPLAGRSGERRYHRGRLIHRLLQRLPEIPPERRAEACRRFLAQPGHGIDPEAQAEIAAETLAVLEDPRFAALFGPGSRAEVPLVGMVGGRVIAGQVDRLVVGEDTVSVIDYKTNRPAPTRVQDVPEAYLDQMAAYRAVLARIYPGRAIHCALLWTDGPRLMALDDEALAARAPS